MSFALLCNCWLRLCGTLYWVLVLQNKCYADWSGWKCRGAARACSVLLYVNSAGFKSGEGGVSRCMGVECMLQVNGCRC
jgi:hypothetical protein